MKAFFWDEMMDKLTTKSIFDGLELIWINIKHRIMSLIDFIKVASKYYSHFPFMKADLSLLIFYLLDSPFVISRRFLQEKGEANIHAYGETPLTSAQLIAETCNITEKDHVFELGCGRGRTCFWLKYFIDCHVTGIDFVPKFIERANRIKTKLKVDNVTFIQDDFMEADFQEATVIYLYGTMLDDDAITSLTKKFKKLTPGTKVITVSYPLSDYSDDDTFELMKRFTVPYPWGTTDVYLQIIK